MLHSRLYAVLGSLAVTALASGQQPGSIAPDAARIDADRLFSFNNGFAVVHDTKGYSLIDGKGQRLALDASIEVTEEGYLNNYCKVRDRVTGLYGFIDERQQLVVPCEWVSLTPCSGMGRAIGMKRSKPGGNLMVYLVQVLSGTRQISEVVPSGLTAPEHPLASDGYSYKLPAVNRAWATKTREGEAANAGDDFTGSRSMGTADSGIEICVADYLHSNVARFSAPVIEVLPVKPGAQRSTLEHSCSWGLIDLTGKIVSQPSFMRMGRPSEGMVAVMKYVPTDKEGKWGYVDLKGAMAIDCRYSNQPSEFHDGFAFIVPTRSEDVEYAIIDKSGAVVKKVAKGECEKRLYGGGGYFSNQKALCSDYKGLLASDFSTFNVLQTLKATCVEPSIPDPLIRCGWFTDVWQGGPSDYYNFEDERKNSPADFMMLSVQYTPNKVGKGVVDHNYRPVVPAVFSSIGPYTDSPGLAWAVFINPDGSKTEGYVNNEGLFEITRDTKSEKW